MKGNFFTLYCFFFSSFLPSTAQQINSIALDLSNSIDSASVCKYINILSSDSLLGRATSTTGMLKASNFAAQIFNKNQLSKLNNGTYFQEIPLVKLGLTKLELRSKVKSYENVLDIFTYGGYGDRKLGDKSVVFAGYGIKDSLWDDYADIDVTDKIVIILAGTPEIDCNKIFKSKYTGNNGKVNKHNIAKEKGAIAILYIPENYSEEYLESQKYFNTSDYLRLPDDKDAPFIYISDKIADDILSAQHYSLSKFRRSTNKHCRPNSIELKAKLRINTNDETASVKCRNTIGILQGSEFPDEYIVVSAHLDHLGERNEQIYHGADDNASGSAALLALTDLFNRAHDMGYTPRRSILFVLFSGEENGLLGSKYYTESPAVPLIQTMVNLNIDMIGRTDTLHSKGEKYVYLIGSNRMSSDLHQISENTNSSYCNLTLDYTYNDPDHKLNLYRRSDHYNFIKKGVPAIFYFSGLHADYHKPTDTFNKIEGELLAKRTQLVFLTLWELANRVHKITLDD